ncbi:MAG: diacylglycerol kinase family lipid kinase, partial [Alistipes sp.]|nr:diacylglycerol kinase family lipid kinase [Candidatus Minthomonas equi]
VVDVDYCTVNGHPFFCTCGVGFDAFISWKFSEAGKRGLVTYMKEAFQNWAGYSPVCYEIETDDGVHLRQTAVLITCANAAQWGNNARIAPHASLTDGLLDVTVVDPLNVLQAGPVAVHLMGGTLHWSPLTKMFKCRSLIIRRPEEGPAHFDGEPMMLGTELEVKVIPEGLKMLVPARKKNI